MLVIDASTLVSAALIAGSVPDRAVHRASNTDQIVQSQAVDTEIATVLHRPKFRARLSVERRERLLAMLRAEVLWIEPEMRVDDCRDAKDNVDLELALAAGAPLMIGSDQDLLVLHPWRGVAIIAPAAYLALPAFPP